MGHYFQLLKNEIPLLQAYIPSNDKQSFFLQEALRFHSVAGTIEQSFHNVSTSIDERIITHILIRSLIENYFKLLYIFENQALSQSRFDECVNGFKLQYLKLYNDKALPNKHLIEPADPLWSTLKPPMDLNSMLTALMNIHGSRLDYIYFVYRISSFDTHGNSLEALFNASFNKKPCNFPVLQIDQVIELIANEYFSIWNNGKVP